MAYDKPKGGMADCVPCPHCGKDIYLSSGGDKKESMEHGPDAGEDWEGDLRHEMSPRTEESEAM